ncbi:protein of unknown function [Brevefilum fermentans]|uniref:Uncharacterized protein n=2 Tax=Candidatus Brevifilum fermentans TaxID=1986204 RepID=A0A1Y6K5D9_9CHLR|nr:protein of unknown function [Brevefilum fermentans]
MVNETPFLRYNISNIFDLEFERVMTIETIFFDFGGVILKQPNERKLKLWKKALGVKDHPEIEEMLENPHDSQLVKDICLGKLPEDYLWTMMAEKWHLRPTVIRFLKRRLSSNRQLNQPIVDFMAELHGQYQVSILSNAGDQTRKLLEDTYQLKRYVDEIIISAEEGVIKPDRRIFEIAMSRLGTTPERSLLLDDHLPNVMAAREFGMHAVQFISPHQAIETVRIHLDGRQS